MIRPGPGDAHGLPPDYDALRRLDETWDDRWSLSWDGLPVTQPEPDDDDDTQWGDLPEFLPRRED